MFLEILQNSQDNTCAGVSFLIKLLVDCFYLVAFLLYSSFYTVALTGVNRYLRNKHYGDFRNFWTTRVALKFIFAAIFLVLVQAVLVLTATVLGKEHISTPIYITTDVAVIGLIKFLQIKTIRTTNTLHNESTVVVSEIINKKITKLSMRIMLLLCFFMTPHLIVFAIREPIRYELNIYKKRILEFFSFTSIILTYANSFANAVLFLTTNVKAKRVLRNFRRQ